MRSPKRNKGGSDRDKFTSDGQVDANSVIKTPALGTIPYHDSVTERDAQSVVHIANGIAKNING